MRHFALADKFDLLLQLLGGLIRVPRPVFDPDEDTELAETLLSEIGQSERYWDKRSDDPDRTEKWHRLHALRNRSDIEVIDLEDDELSTFAELQTPAYARSLGFAAPLGAGEAAVVAVAEHRQWDAIIDDAEGRAAFADRVPDRTAMTSRDLLRSGVANGHLTSDQAADTYLELREGGYYGPPSLWS